jgi:hypothetical protein
MGMYAHIRTKNDIEYGNSFGNNYGIDDFLQEIREFEKLTNTDLIEYLNEDYTSLEINYLEFIKAYQGLSQKQNIPNSIKKLYEEAFNQEACIKYNSIYIDWF